jgi:hypothetical protein
MRWEVPRFAVVAIIIVLVLIIVGLAEPRLFGGWGVAP